VSIEGLTPVQITVRYITEMRRTSPVVPRTTVDSRRVRSLDRSVEGARSRAADRYDRLVAAGRSLMQDHGSTDFAVPEVARRARTSLRAFYELFANKDELLLAVFDQAIRETAARLRAAIADHDDPVDQLGAYVRTLFAGTFDDDHPEIPAMVGLHLRLAADDPSGLAAVLAPQTELLVEVLQRGVTAGRFRRDIDVGALAVIVSQALIATVHTKALGAHLVGTEVDVEAVWAFCLAGVSPVDAGPRRRRGR
jgi:AcrR family transcriptional regulator